MSPKSSSETLIWRKSVDRTVPSVISTSYVRPVRLSVTDSVSLPSRATSAPAACVSVSVLIGLPLAVAVPYPDGRPQRSQPPLVLGGADRLAAVARPGLADGRREVVAHGPGREVQCRRDVGHGGVLARGGGSRAVRTWSGSGPCSRAAAFAAARRPAARRSQASRCRAARCPGARRARPRAPRRRALPARRPRCRARGRAARPGLRAPSPGPRPAARGSPRGSYRHDGPHAESRAVVARAGLQATAGLAQALLQPGQAAAVALRAVDPAAVVEDLDAGLVERGDEADRAVARAAVADHVGGRLAHGPGEHRLDVGGQLHRRPVDRRLDPGGVERRPRALKLGVERRLAVAADRFADLAQRLATDGLDVADVDPGVAAVSGTATMFQGLGKRSAPTATA